MKKMFFLAAAMLLAVSTLSAKPDKPEKEFKKDGKERIEKQIKFYVDTFGLDEQKAAQFSEMYRSYNKALHAIHEQYKPEKRVNRDVPPTDEEIEKHMLADFAKSRAILNTRETYYKRFRTILSAKQVAMIYHNDKCRKEGCREDKKHAHKKGEFPSERPDFKPNQKPDHTVSR